MAIVHGIADVILVHQQIVNDPSRPRPTRRALDPGGIQAPRNLRLASPLNNELPEDRAHLFDLFQFTKDIWQIMESTIAEVSAPYASEAAPSGSSKVRWCWVGPG